MKNIDRKKIEKEIKEKIKNDIVMIETSIVSQLITGENIMVIGEEEDIDVFCNYLEYSGINVHEDISMVMMGVSRKGEDDKEVVMPLKLNRYNRSTGEISDIFVNMLKKSDKLTKIVMENVKTEEDMDKFDMKRLLVIELQPGGNVVSRFIENEDEFTEENIKKVTRGIFNPQKTFEHVVDNFRKEMDNESVMYR